MAALGELIRAAPELSRNPATSNVQFVPKWTSSCAAQHFVAARLQIMLAGERQEQGQRVGADAVLREIDQDVAQGEGEPGEPVGISGEKVAGRRLRYSSSCAVKQLCGCAAASCRCEKPIPSTSAAANALPMVDLIFNLASSKI